MSIFFYKNIDASAQQLQTSESHKAVRFVLMQGPFFILKYVILVTSLILSHNNKNQTKCSDTQLKL